MNVIMELEQKILLEIFSNQKGIPIIAGPKPEGMPFSGMI